LRMSCRVATKVSLACFTTSARLGILTCKQKDANRKV
jgi:hypothetical protein